MKQSAGRAAFGRTEIVVSVLVAAMMVALLLPALHAARESARVTQCRNNLKEMGLAMHNYHDSQKLFPPGIIGRGQCRVFYPRSFPEGISARGDATKPPDMLPVTASPFRSYHRGFCHMLFADLAVRQVTTEMDPKLFAELGSVRGTDIGEGPP